MISRNLRRKASFPATKPPGFEGFFERGPDYADSAFGVIRNFPALELGLWPQMTMLFRPFVFEDFGVFVLRLG